MQKLILMLSITCGICLSSCTAAPQPRAFESRSSAKHSLDSAMLKEYSGIRDGVTSLITSGLELERANARLPAPGARTTITDPIIEPGKEIQGLVTDVMDLMMARNASLPEEEIRELLEEIRSKLRERDARLKEAGMQTEIREHGPGV